MYKILIIDDDVAVTNYLMVFLMQHEVYEPTVINDSREVEETIGRELFDTILLDMDMPNIGGMDILKLLNAREINTPVVVLSGVNDADLAVMALKLGALDYLTKPVDEEVLLEVMGKAIKQHELDTTLSQLPPKPRREDLEHAEAFQKLPTHSPSMIRLFHEAESMASGELPVFLVGERGCGKRTLAKAIHNASPRKDEVFVVADSAISRPDAFTEEFFGHAAGWQQRPEEKIGLIAQAEGGTLFISHVEQLSRPMTLRLERLMRTREYNREGSARVRTADVRLIVSSDRDLSSKYARDSFTRDLLHQLWTNSIKVLPLRARNEDVPLLSEYFAQLEAQRLGREAQTVDIGLSAFLQRYAFPGNLEELHDVIASAVRREAGPTLHMASLSPYLRERIAGHFNAQDYELRSLAEAQQDHVRRTVYRVRGDHRRAASVLGISEEQLEEYLRD